MELNYGTSTFDRQRGNFPRIPVVNMFAEQVPTDKGITLQSRPGIDNSGIVMGAGPVKTLFQIDGVLSNQLFGVSAGHLYSSAIDLGAIDGSGPAVISGFETLIFATAGSSLWKYNGTTLASVATPGGFSVLSLCIGTSRLIVIDKDTGHFYWSDVLSSNIDALSFATAENSPDKLKECLFIGDSLYLFGSETVETWPANISNPDLPFQPLVGRTFQVGIRDTGCATTFTNTFAWITNRNQICAGDANNIISSPSIEDKLTNSGSARLWTFLLEGVQFLALTLDTETWVFSSRTSTWSTFESYGQTNWVPQCYTGGYFGSSINGNLIQFKSNYSDFGGVLERNFRAGLPINSGTQPVNNVTLRCNPGQTTVLSGLYSDPQIEMRTSKDGGFEWSPWKSRSLGTLGKYRNVVMWRALGYFGFPGGLFDFRVTDPVPFRVSGIVANEPTTTV